MNFKSMHGFCEETMSVKPYCFFSVAKLKVFSKFLSRKKKGINLKFMQKNFKI